jgi:hypothetical protein
MENVMLRKKGVERLAIEICGGNAANSNYVIEPCWRRQDMDPITLIITALVAGASAAAKDTASQAIKDGYAGLKAIIQKRFAAKQEAEVILQQHENDPDTWKKPLAKSLEESGATQDPRIIEVAQQLLQLVHPEQHAQGKFNVQVTGPVQGQQVGDYGTQSNVFGARPDQK